MGSVGEAQNVEFVKSTPYRFTPIKLSDLPDWKAPATIGKPKSIWKDWLLETICCLFSLTILVILWFFLFYYDGKPSPQWPHKALINTLVSIFVVATKTMLQYLLSQGE